MQINCTCGADKGLCVDCMQDFIDRVQALHAEVKELCDFICNSSPNTKIAGKIDTMAFSIAHHPFILNSKRYVEGVMHRVQDDD